MTVYAVTSRGGAAVYRHVLVAEKALEKRLPPHACIHHVNDKRKDNGNANLVICENHAYHFLLHVRARVVRAGGDPNTQRICSYGKHLVSKADCRQIGPDKYSSDCRACAVIRNTVSRKAKRRA